MQLNTDISNTLDILKWFVSQESRLVRENKVWLYLFYLFMKQKTLYNSIKIQTAALYHLTYKTALSIHFIHHKYNNKYLLDVSK